MRQFAALAFAIALPVAAAAGPVDDFREARLFVWGAGATLPAPYTQTQDVTITVRTWTRLGFFDIPLPTQTLTGPIDEAPYVKSAGDLGFVIDPQAINPIFPGTPFAVTGAVQPGDVVRWTWDTTQAGPFVIQATFLNPPNPDIVVNLTLSNVRIFGELNGQFAGIAPRYHSVIDAYSNVEFRHTGGDPRNFINVRPGTVTGTVSGVSISRLEIDLRTIQHVGHVMGDVCAARGTISREFFDGTVAGGEQVQWSLVDPSTRVTVSSGTLTLSADGRYEFATDAPAGSYHLAMQGATWLAAAKENVVLGPIVSTHDFALRNGDCTGDNVVDLDDFLVLAASYETVFGAPGYVAAADLDKNGAVDLGDFLTLAANYETEGWRP